MEQAWGPGAGVKQGSIMHMQETVRPTQTYNLNTIMKVAATVPCDLLAVAPLGTFSEIAGVARPAGEPFILLRISSAANEASRGRTM